MPPAGTGSRHPQPGGHSCPLSQDRAHAAHTRRAVSWLQVLQTQLGVRESEQVRPSVPTGSSTEAGPGAPLARQRNAQVRRSGAQTRTAPEAARGFLPHHPSPAAFTHISPPITSTHALFQAETEERSKLGRSKEAGPIPWWGNLSLWRGEREETAADGSHPQPLLPLPQPYPTPPGTD